ncbi:ATP-dependent nuclease [Pseudomonas urmiensis]|uniref:ATP-dependent nuclease n=1 Tax=Pseudomonas urmiensis TaxID=2745493 RepID=UPI003D0FB90E
MRLHSLKIRNLRTITDEQVLIFSSKTTLVGANNSGKSNTLLAIKYFFTGYENGGGYDYQVDLPFKDGNGQTTLVAQFELDHSDNRDRELKTRIGRLSSWLVDYKGDSAENLITVHLTFRRSVPIYQLFPGQKQLEDRKDKYPEFQKEIIRDVLDRFTVYYIPSEKSIARIYSDLVLPFIKKKIAHAILPYQRNITDSIRNLTDSMNASFAEVGVEGVTVDLDYPEGVFDNLIAGLELSVQDSSSSSLYSKGMGLQSTVLFSALEWVTRQHEGSIVTWLIEEPETYMHPSLACKACRILDKIAQSSILVRTTHSLSFVPGSTKHVNGVELCSDKNNTLIQKYKSYRDATKAIRMSLGVKFSDFFGLADINIFVEGETDEEYLRTAIKNYEIRNERPLLIGSHHVRFLSFGGCTELAGFIRANYANISKEVVAVSLFDGDAAAEAQISSLEGFFGNKGGFHSERDYTIIPARGEIESVFPDDWIKEIHSRHKGLFQTYRLDAASCISAFKIASGSKRKFMEIVLDLMKNPHHEPVQSLDTIVEALERIVTKRATDQFPDLLTEWRSEFVPSDMAKEVLDAEKEWALPFDKQHEYAQRFPGLGRQGE